MGRTFLKFRDCSASWVRQFGHTWVLDPLRLLAIVLRHCLTTDGWGDCFLTIYVMLCRFSHGLDFLNMLARRGIASTNTGGKGKK